MYRNLPLRGALLGLVAVFVVAAYSAASGLRPAEALTSQTITFPSIFTKTYGVAPFTISPTASSGLPVSLAVLSGPCSLSAPTSPADVTVLGVGSCSIQATQAGDATYAAASPVTRTFTILKASQSITFGSFPAGLTYGVVPFPVSATATSGLTVSLAIITGPCSLVQADLVTPATTSPAYVKVNGAGSCWLRATQPGNANYYAAFPQNKIFSIARANLTITADSPPPQPYGSPIPVIGGTAVGLVNGDTLGSLGTLSCYVSALSISSVGTYQTWCSGLISSNYNITYVKGTLTIVKADQIISIDSVAPKTVGDPSFSVTTSSISAVTSTSTGLFVTLYSDTPSVCTVNATWFGPVTILSDGVCTLRAEQAGSANFNAAVPVTLDITILPAP